MKAKTLSVTLVATLAILSMSCKNQKPKEVENKNLKSQNYN